MSAHVCWHVSAAHALLVSGRWLPRSHFLRMTPARFMARGMFTLPDSTMTALQLSTDLAVTTATVSQLAPTASLNRGLRAAEPAHWRHWHVRVRARELCWNARVVRMMRRWYG